MHAQTEDELNLSVAQSVLDRLLAEDAELAAERERCLDRLKELDTRMAELHGTSSRGGKIDRAKERLRIAQQQLEDAKLPLVVWVHAPQRAFQSTECPNRVCKVTSKRIYLKQPGDPEHACYYRKSDGLRDFHPSDRSWGVLDVQACLAAWDRYVKTANV